MSRIWRVAVVEKTVLDVTAHKARCLECGWESRWFDGKSSERGALKAARAHGSEHAAEDLTQYGRVSIGRAGG